MISIFKSLINWVFFYGIVFSTIILFKCNISVWNWSNTMNILSALWILMVFSTRALVATRLSMHLRISSCTWVNSNDLMIMKGLKTANVWYWFSNLHPWTNTDSMSSLLWLLGLLSLNTFHSGNKFNSLWPSEAIWHQWTSTSFIILLWPQQVDFLIIT